MPGHLASAILSVLLLGSYPAQAGPLNLRWNACWGDGGTMNRLFSCNTNAGTNVLVASFVPTHDYADAIQVDANLTFAVAGTSLPPWWQFRTAGSCRLSSFNVSPALPAGAVNCEDWSGGNAATLISTYAPDAFGPGSASMVVSSATSAGTTVPLLQGHEYFAFQVLINNQKTVGTGACAGCELGGCLAIRFVRVTTPTFSDVISTPNFSSDDRLVTWQGGAGVILITSAQYMSCPRATPTRNSTWGAVKSLYR